MAGLLAGVLLLGGLGVTIPRSLSRYRALRAAQEELTALQLEINRLQFHIVDRQKRTLELQRQIQAASRK